jgi:KilA-N domain
MRRMSSPLEAPAPRVAMSSIASSRGPCYNPSVTSKKGVIGLGGPCNSRQMPHRHRSLCGISYVRPFLVAHDGGAERHAGFALRVAQSANPVVGCRLLGGRWWPCVLSNSQEPIMANTLVLGTFDIRECNGLFSLNDLHLAAGSAARHKPSEWLRNQQTKELVGEIQKAGIPAITSKQKAGTFACRELVIAYAAWISAAFHLKVIRVFLAATASGGTTAQAPEPRLDDLHCQQIEAVINHLRAKHDFNAPDMREELCRYSSVKLSGRNRSTAQFCAKGWATREGFRPTC